MTESGNSIYAPRVSRDLRHETWNRVLDFVAEMDKIADYFETQREAHVDITLLSAREIGESYRKSDIDSPIRAISSDQWQNSIIKDAFRLPAGEHFINTSADKVSLIKSRGNYYAALVLKNSPILITERQLMLNSLAKKIGYQPDYPIVPRIILGKVDPETPQEVFDRDVHKVRDIMKTDILNINTLPINVEKDIRTKLFVTKYEREAQAS